MDTRELIELTQTYSARNYAPLDVVVRAAEGVWVTDVEGHRYIDFLSAYSALNFGHRHPRITAAAHRQLDTLTLTSRAFYSEEFAYFCRDLVALCGGAQGGMRKALVMNSGTEAVETALKAARKWGYEVKGIPEDAAEIIVFSSGFHGRSIAIVGFSSSVDVYRGFGPFPRGFRVVPFGDADAVEAAISDSTAAVLVEPILGEGGIIIPPAGFLGRVRQLCTERNVLFLADEIQTGLCRTGKLFACQHEGVVPDLYILGKSLGGGIVPISAIVADEAVMQVFTPGVHGSTFGGNPFACAIGREVISLIQDEKFDENAGVLGQFLVERLRAIKSPYVTAVRGRGLMIGVDIDPAAGTAKEFCKRFKDVGVLCKDTRKQTIRIAPPLVITKDEVEWALERIAQVLEG